MRDLGASSDTAIDKSASRARSQPLGLPRDRALLAGAAIAMAIASLIIRPPILFVWNSSSSVPQGLYFVEHSGRIARGEFVLARVPHPQREIADERRYIPASIPIVKIVVGVAGDQACAMGATVRITGRLPVRRLSMDPAGRSMMWWKGCRRLSSHEVMLLGSSRLSFDGRYFGPTKLEDLEGRAVPMWTR